LIAYQHLAAMQPERAAANALEHARSARMATYALCGFANLASIGVQIGGTSQLAPERRGDIARLAFKAMLAGAIATCMTATIAGLFV
jgi:nucleoside permease NupC